MRPVEAMSPHIVESEVRHEKRPWLKMATGNVSGDEGKGRLAIWGIRVWLIVRLRAM